MNNFFEKQNEPLMLRLLAAQRFIYSKVKILLWWSFCLGVVVPSCLTFFFFILSFIPGFTFPWLKSFLTVYGLGFLIINNFLLNYITTCKKQAAKIQEEYDTLLYDMPWNEIVAEKKVSVSDSDSPARSYLEKNGDSSLKNWYLNFPINVNSLIMRMLCQSKNLGWDARLKRKTSFIVTIIMAINIALFSVSMLFANLEFLKFIAFVAIIMPIYQFYHRFVNENKKAAEKADSLRVKVESALQELVEKKVIENEKLEKLTRSIQDQIFTYRASGNPVPDYIHKYFRDSDEETYDSIFNTYALKLQ
ncbi:S-4TM family putative pore-forming effector [Pantoea sp. BS_8]|uniref:S-4TM family putative pore-forming effector n=1 Tax=Pantoea sp. BS_8 TaxID=3055781 RepID=UPI0035C15461